MERIIESYVFRKEKGFKSINLICNLLLIWCCYLLYLINNYYSFLLSVIAINILFYIAFAYSILSIYTFLQKKRGKTFSIGFRFFYGIKATFLSFFRNGKIELKRNTKKKTLFTIVKVFYIPLMINFTVNNCVFLIERINNLQPNGDFIYFFNRSVYPVLLSALFFIDTLFFSFGYLFESKILKNTLRSVDTTFGGWIVTLICYPPFNQILAEFAPFSSNDYAFFGTELLTFTIRLLLICLIFIYVSATICLGTKCSNLTNRGIVQKGPYRLVRHPAYVSKVLFWWITLMPVMYSHPSVTLSATVWTIIYILRAYTEERHLLNDFDYQVYCKKVKYRFVPFIY